MKTQRTKVNILKLSVYLYIMAVWILLVAGGDFCAAVSFFIPCDVPNGVMRYQKGILYETTKCSLWEAPEGIKSLTLLQGICDKTSYHKSFTFLQDISSKISYYNYKSPVISKEINKNINQNLSSATSTRYRYKKRFQETLLHYQNFASLYEPDFSTAVPGLEYTDILGESCNQMVPQGICIAGEYMLVTAYDNIGLYDKKKGGKNHKVNHSVIYILSNQNPQNRKLLTTIILPDINHVGGITFDGKNVWIAKSTDRQCSVISYNVIKDAAKSGKSSYKLERYDQNVPCGVVASFVTWHKGMLWVGTYSNCIKEKGNLRSYKVQKKETEQKEVFTLQKQDEIIIPNYANGAAFMEVEGKTYLAVSTSKGRYFDSKIYFYELLKDCLTEKNLYYNYNILKFPPMAEELVCHKGNMYFLFESSATCYSTLGYQRCNYPVDRICAVSTKKLLRKNQEGLYQKADFRKKELQRLVVLGDMYQEKKYWKKFVCLKVKSRLI